MKEVVEVFIGTARACLPPYARHAHQQHSLARRIRQIDWISRETVQAGRDQTPLEPSITRITHPERRENRPPLRRPDHAERHVLDYRRFGLIS